MSGVEAHHNETDGGIKCKERKNNSSVKSNSSLTNNPFDKIGNNQPAKLS